MNAPPQKRKNKKVQKIPNLKVLDKKTKLLAPAWRTQGNEVELNEAT